MKIFKQYSNYAFFSMLFVFMFFVAGCGGGSDGGSNNSVTTPPSVSPKIISTTPTIDDINVTLNSNIVALFDKALNPNSVTLATFSLATTIGNIPIAGAVSYDNNTMIFDPSVDLTANTTYSATITTGVTDLAGNALAVEKIWSFTTEIDTTLPTIMLTGPLNTETDVPINRNISALFSEKLDPNTVTLATFTLATTIGNIPVAGIVNYGNNTMIFNPTADLNTSTEYTATITTGVTDLAGNTLAVHELWSFTTGTIPDTTAPTVILTDPLNAETNVMINKNTSAIFSEALDPTTVTLATFTVVTTIDNIPVTGIVSYGNNTMIFNPTTDLNASTGYTATITTGVTDLAGNPLAVDKVWSFTTNTTSPTVISTDPLNAEIDVPINRSISALFSKTLNPTTITTATFTVVTTIDNIPVTGIVSYDNNTMIFNPTTDLNASTEYTATITTGVTDLAGNPLAVDKVWNFTTGATKTIVLAPVDLGTAGSFAILTKAGITTTGGTAITGDIGASPIALTAITGFGTVLDSSGIYATSPLVTGKIYAANMTPPTPDNMTTAIGDMEAAYTDAAGRTSPDFTELGAGDVSGMTLAPGLYKWGTPLLITNAGVTLSGSATDVWIFQIAGTLTLDNGAIVHLAGGALAKNVFWQFTSASLGTTADFKGVALAQTAITVNTGATVNGRLLAQTAVTLNANAITQP